MVVLFLFLSDRVEQLLASAAEYKRRFAAFFHLVRAHQSYDLAFLAFRLDFNEYYESLELARRGDGAAEVEAGAA